ncbi:MAG: hypothetical protein WBA93_14710 [Microcoleaceae cyanobacterium]
MITWAKAEDDSQLEAGKVWRNKDGRWFERLPNVYEPSVRLRKIKFRRSRFSGATDRYKQGKHEYWIDKQNLLIEK